MRGWPRRLVLLLVGLGWLALPSVAQAACTGSSPTWTTTPDLASVAACVAGASTYDTINVSAGDGSETWDTALTITKGINLIGPGAANLTITSGHAGTLITYTPSDYTLDTPFRVSGFTFDLAEMGTGIELSYTIGSADSVPMQTNVRIDHNTFTNLVKTVGDNEHQAIRVYGQRGVIDHNTVTDGLYPVRFSSGSIYWWTATTPWEGMIFGAWNNNMYLEDNVISFSGDTITNCQYSNRYAWRYNDIVSTKADGAYGMFDMHGNQPPASNMYPCFGGELYGNDITVQSSGGYYLSVRGGRHAAFYNYIRGNNFGIKVYEDYCDAENPSTHEQSSHTSDSYNWANYETYPSVAPITAYNGTPDVSATCDPAYNVNHGSAYWSFSATYDGTVPGVGCGTTLPSVCTTGDGYWVTSQSCSDITPYVGTNPSNPIQGTFYTCASTNTWASKFTPLVYPHPFLSVPTAPSSFTPIQIASAVYLQWTHSGVGVTHYRTVVDSTTTAIVGEPLVSGTTTTYRTALPTLAAGQHTVRVDACNWEGCTATAEIIVVKL